MKERCGNTKCKAYKWYGARGISVCKRWSESFANFIEDMGRKPSPKHSIDRIDGDGNYEPGNCHWATWSQQANNRRNSISDGEKARAINLRQQGKTLREIGALLGRHEKTVGNIIRASRIA